MTGLPSLSYRPLATRPLDAAVCFHNIGAHDGGICAIEIEIAVVFCTGVAGRRGRFARIDPIENPGNPGGPGCDGTGFSCFRYVRDASIALRRKTLRPR